MKRFLHLLSSFFTGFIMAAGVVLFALVCLSFVLNNYKLLFNGPTLSISLAVCFVAGLIIASREL